MKKYLLFILLFIAATSQAQTSYYITSADATQLYIQEFGKGKPLIILAGGPGLNAVYMDSVWIHLSSHYRCIIPDQRGTGKSVLTSIDSASLSMENYVNDLEALREYLKLDQMILVGHSWGGMLAMQYAGLHPLQTEKLMLLDPGGPTSKFFSYFGDNIVMRLHEEDLHEAELLDSLKQRSIKAIWPGYFFDRQRAMELKGMVTEEIYGQDGVNEKALNNYTAVTEERIRLLKNYKGDVCLIQGRQDPVGESTMYEIKEILPQTLIHIIERCGHFPWLENKEQSVEFYELLVGCIN